MINAGYFHDDINKNHTKIIKNGTIPSSQPNSINNDIITII